MHVGGQDRHVAGVEGKVRMFVGAKGDRRSSRAKCKELLNMILALLLVVDSSAEHGRSQK